MKLAASFGGWANCCLCDWTEKHTGEGATDDKRLLYAELAAEVAVRVHMAKRHARVMVEKSEAGKGRNGTIRYNYLGPYMGPELRGR